MQETPHQETPQEVIKASFLDKIGCGIFYVFIGIIYVLWAIDFLYGTPEKKIFGFIMLVVFVLFTGALLKIKPFQWGFAYFIDKILTPTAKALLEIVSAVIEPIGGMFRGISRGLPMLLGIVGFVILAVVAFAIVKWAFNYVF